MNGNHLLCAALLAIGLCSGGAAESATPDRHDLTWHAPSTDANGSTPLGNGDIGMNAWIEPSGEPVFYISKTDSWGDNARLLKIGRVRVRFTPSPPLTNFRQTVRLNEGTMEAIYLLPAWPPDWDLEFKPHAPYHTTVECVYRGGKIAELKVAPAKRRKDVVITEGHN
jgi:uncharacterized protein DUF5703